MSADSQVSAIRVDDQDFLVTSTIERCPKVMMVRELFKNALEAAADAPEDGKVNSLSATFKAPPSSRSGTTVLGWMRKSLHG